MVSFAKFHRHGLGSPPSCFMRALYHHYGVELQHFSPNAITTAVVFAAVCEGNLGIMPHWDLWLHLYRGELFNAPSGTTWVRKSVRVGCLNLVLKTGKAEEPREYIPVGLTSNHAGWDSQWFYLRNNDDLFPDYTGRLISERQEHWKYDVVKTLQPWLRPILDALKKLRGEGLTTALVLSAEHHRRVLPLMSRQLRMDEMGPGVSCHDLEACRMSNEAPADDEVAARVRAAVAGDFQPEQVNGFPMRPDVGSIDLVSLSFLLLDFSIRFWGLLSFLQDSINARSSRPPMKEDDVDRDKRHESAEKQKSMKDLEKKKEKKKKNLEQQALEKRRAKSRQRGESEEESPDEDDGGDGDDGSDDSEGMAARLDKILEGPPQADVNVAQTGAPKKASGVPHDGQRRESSPSRSRVATPPPPTAPGQSVLGLDPLPHSERATGPSLR